MSTSSTASRSRPASAFSAVLAATLLGACSSAPIYKPDPNAPNVPTNVEGALHLPPPPPLPPLAPPADLNELKSFGSPELLRPGDIVSVNVRDEPDLSVAKARIARDGTLRLPWLGELKVGGTTRAALEKTIAEKIQRTYVKSPDVVVELHGDECRRAYVLGRVTRPGPVPLPADQSLTLVKVIALAGGLSAGKGDLEADASTLRLTRTIDGNRRTFRVSFEQIVEGSAPDIVIDPEDIVFVPSKRELFVFGSVVRPGAFPLADGSRLSIDEVLNLAGGFAATAQQDRVTLIRHAPSGATESYHVNLLDERQRATVQVTASDTVIVGDRQARRVFVFGKVARPGSYTLDEQNLTLIKVLALAGGLLPTANGNGVKLLRQTPEGQKVYTVPVAAMLANEADLRGDPVLLPGDLITVPESFF